ncbi:MAG: hypothetical protein K0S14_338 [Thermomicrobiales bacterium]|nr:hypothetical protein [Thermomicrobiales bacterium]
MSVVETQSGCDRDREAIEPLAAAEPWLRF